MIGITSYRLFLFLVSSPSLWVHRNLPPKDWKWLQNPLGLLSCGWDVRLLNRQRDSNSLGATRTKVPRLSISRSISSKVINYYTWIARERSLVVGDTKIVYLRFGRVVGGFRLQESGSVALSSPFSALDLALYLFFVQSGFACSPR
jgi:hypothetical protein